MSLNKFEQGAVAELIYEAVEGFGEPEPPTREFIEREFNLDLSQATMALWHLHSALEDGRVEVKPR